MRPPPGPVSDPDRQGAEGGFPWLVVGLGAAVGFVWGGAAVAAAVTGHAGAVTFPHAAEALFALPANLGDPAAAWPAPARAALPGPVLYWSCQALVAAAIAGAGFGGWRLRCRLLRDRPGSLGVKEDAGFASRADLAQLAVPSPQPGRITLGRSRGRLLAGEPQASLAVVGPTGCGKTAGFAIPAILEWRGPVIATSVKADLLEASIEHRRSRGTVWVYDPAACAGHGSDPWSPLASCTTWTGAMRMAAWMTDAAQARLDSLADGDYWYSQARKALAPYLYAAASSAAGLRDLVRWVDSQEIDAVERALRARIERDAAAGDAALRWDELWAASIEVCRAYLARTNDDRAALARMPVQDWPDAVVTGLARVVDAEWRADLADRGLDPDADPLSPLVAAVALWCKEPRLRGSVFATMENVLAGWADPGVSRPFTAEPIDLDKWLAGDNTIFVVAAAHEQARLRPVLTVLVQQAIRAAYDNANARGGTLEQPCLVLLDEAGNTAPLRDLPGYASTARSHGITLVSVWQDLAQIKAAYKDRAQTVLNNHRAKLFGAGIADEATLDYVSRLVGDEPRTERNVSTDLHGGRRSVSEESTYRRAAPIDALRRVKPGEGVLIYGSELPVHVRLRPWFGDRALRVAAGRPDLLARGRRRSAHLRR